MTRHFTASGVVLHSGRVLLIQHAKLGWWLPPGGHLEIGEDPVQAVLREVREEVGIECSVIAEEHFAHDHIRVIPPPFTILQETSAEGDGQHEHVDFIYALRPLSTQVRTRTDEISNWRWVPVDEVGTLFTPPELASLVRAVSAYIASFTVADNA